MTPIALVGTAHIHTPGFADRLEKNKDVKVVAVWDHDGARAKKYTDRFSAKWVKDPAEIWQDKSIPAVVICSETNRHLDLVLSAAAARKHMFVEKPLGITRSDSTQMRIAIEEAGTIFQTGYFRRNAKAYQDLKALLTSEALGTVTRVRDTCMHTGSIGGWFDTEWRWMADLSQAGVGAFGDLGAHSLDLLLWLLGEIDSVTGLINPVTKRYGECDETGEALLKFKSGANGTLGAGWLDHGNPLGTQVSGLKGHAVVRDNQLLVNCKELTGKDGFEPYDGGRAELPHAFDLFLEAINGKRGLPLVTIAEAAYGVTVMEAIYKGAAKREWISIS